MLNEAQTLLMSFFPTQGEGRIQETPVFNRGTPPRKRIPRAQRFHLYDDETRGVRVVRKPRLFKGHRP